MWGNATGWTISAILLLFLALTMHALIGMGKISDPTSFGTDPANLGAFALPTAPATLLSMNGPADATAQYRDALADALAHPHDYDLAAGFTRVADIANLPAIKNLLATTHADGAAIFANDPGAVITYSQTTKLDAMVSLGHLLARAGLLEQIDDPAAAIPYFEAECALGCRLYEERLTVAEFTSGVDLLAESAGGMARALDKANQHVRAAAVRQFDADRLVYYNQRILPMLKVVRSIDPTTVSDHAGDIFYFATHAQERMWRIEAIFALGRMRYFVGDNGRIGDQRGAVRLLKKLSRDNDPLIHLAATEAEDMTIEQYRAQR